MATHPAAPGTPSLDGVHGLIVRARTFPPTCLRDAVGGELSEKIARLPECRPFRIRRSLVRRVNAGIVVADRARKSTGPGPRLGSGDQPLLAVDLVLPADGEASECRADRLRGVRRVTTGPSGGFGCADVQHAAVREETHGRIGRLLPRPPYAQVMGVEDPGLIIRRDAGDEPRPHAYVMFRLPWRHFWEIDGAWPWSDTLWTVLDHRFGLPASLPSPVLTSGRLPSRSFSPGPTNSTTPRTTMAYSAAAHPLLVLGAGIQAYSEYSLRRLAAIRPIVLADPEPPAWTRPYVSDDVVIDLADHEAASTAVKRVAEHTPFAGVCTYAEDHVELTARLATQLGLPGGSSLSSAACRDTAYRRVGEHGVLRAQSVPAGDEDSAVGHARRLGYPVVVRPRGREDGAGALRADDDAEVRQAYHQACWETAFGPEAETVVGVLVEECLVGSEISAETVVLDGDVHITAVTRARLGPEPGYLKTGYVVDASDPLLDDPAVTRTVAHAVRALGIERGVLHVELRLAEPGPELIKVNASPGGDLVPLLVELATGIDLLAATAALATGARPDLTPTHQRAAAAHFLYPADAGRLGPVRPPTAPYAQPWLERLVWTRQTGERVTAPPHASVTDRLAHWVVTGDSAAECRQRLADVLSQVTGPAAQTAPH
ncbi:ATP-grasp domain-containing protein [Streptomyces sp. R08]|uniref:ATP-grasp domain-containing protein n=1 Tax=Streptomyces sp. R08 TaxID=3238624 RepID=A0AB39MEZ1_9ACTN